MDWGERAIGESAYQEEGVGGKCEDWGRVHGCGCVVSVGCCRIVGLW